MNFFYGISYVSLQNSGAVATWTKIWWWCRICNKNHSVSFTFPILFFIEIHHFHQVSPLSFRFSWMVNWCHFDQILKQTRYSVAIIVTVRHREDTACASLKIGRKAACCSKTRTFCAFLCQAARCARYLLVHGGFLLLVGQRCRTCTCSLTHASLES